MSRVNAAVAKGDAYVLAAPELATKSGGKAEFLAGGEIPIPKAGALGAVDVEYKKYGMILHISPVIDANNNITAKIETELSHIDAGVTYGGFPGFLTRRTESEVSMRAGETMAISGLIDAETSKAGDSVPLLGSIPILGRLFRSDAFQHRRSDLVIFVTPEVYDPTSAKNAELLARAAQIQQGEQAMSGEASPQPPVAPTPATPLPPVPPRAHDTRLQAAQPPTRQESPAVPAAATPATPAAAAGPQDAVAPALARGAIAPGFTQEAVTPAVNRDAVAPALAQDTPARLVALGLNQSGGEGTPRGYCWSCVTAGTQ
jgi:pilus assembly protein CpaC